MERLASTLLALTCACAEVPKPAPSTGGVTPASTASASAVAAAASSATPEAAASESLDTIIQVGALRLHLRCEGAGEPLVVLEAGLGLDGSSWRRVQPAVAQFTRTCAYDRAGRGMSGPAPYPHDQRRMAEELHALLETAEQRGPYVLVGHSMGGAIARWFLHAHAHDVAGMVLVDAATEEWPERVLTRVPPEALPDFWRNLRAWEGLDAQTYVAGYADLRGSTATLGDRPLFVLTAGKPEAELDLRMDMQSKLLRLSSNSVQRIVHESAHNLQLESPSEVTGAISAVVRAVRAGSRVSELYPGAP